MVPASRSLAAVLLAVALAPVGPARGVVRHVPGDHPTITAAFAASSPGDTVRVGPGTHSAATTGETFPLFVPHGDLHLIGAGAEVTILDAAGTSRVLHWDVPGTGTIADLTVTGGSHVVGAGIFVRQGAPEIRDTVVRGNTATTRGAGMFIRGDSQAWIHHNVVWENVDADTSDLVDPHGIVFSDSSAALAEHNVVGRTDGNGLLSSDTAAPVVRHNIIVENGQPGPPLRGRGMCWFSTAPPTVTHNLFHANELAALLWPDGGGDFSGTEANDIDPDDGIFGNLDGDPLHVDPDAGDFRLQWGSPAIDAGDPALPHDPDGTVADLGPFWFDQGAVGAPPLAGAAPGRPVARPNPFRGTTTLVLAAPADGVSRTIDVLDVTGRRVRSWQRPPDAGGAIRVVWDGRDEAGRPVAAGVYWVRARGAEGSGTAAVVRLR